MRQNRPQSMIDVAPKYPSSTPAFHPVLPIPLDFSLQESVSAPADAFFAAPTTNEAKKFIAGELLL
jgi:hypothetical protein